MYRLFGAWASLGIVSLAVVLLGFDLPGSGGQANAQYTFTTLNYPGGSETNANGISPLGVVVGQYDSGGTTRPFLRTAAGVYSTFTVPGAGPFASANGMNASGQVVGFYSPDGNVAQAYLRTGTTYQFLTPHDGSPDVEALSINNAGHVVGLFEDTSDYFYRGFLYDGVGYTTLQYPGASATKAIGINNHGDIVGGYYVASTDTQHGFLYSGGVYSTVEPPGGLFPEAQGINDSGQIVGQYQSSFGDYHGFIKNGSAYSDIDAPSSVGTQAFAINNAGQVVGIFNSNGVTRGFLATPSAAADFNIDGQVNDLDLTAWSGGFGLATGAVKADGDANGDFAVDGKDFLIWQTQLSVGRSATPTSLAVPEPAATTLAMVSIVGLAGYHRSRRELGAR